MRGPNDGGAALAALVGSVPTGTRNAVAWRPADEDSSRAEAMAGRACTRTALDGVHTITIAHTFDIR